MSGAPRDEDAVRHPHHCEFCGGYRPITPVGMRLLTRKGHILKVCADCFEKFPAQYKQLVEDYVPVREVAA